MQRIGKFGLSGVLLGNAAGLFGHVGGSSAQTIQLQPIIVLAPSPIQRTAPALGAVAPALQGTLPIVTDQFATVTVVPREELQRSPGTTLGDVLFAKPGITGSSFAPGSASRPIIRGLDVNRVGIIDNGVSGGGVSDLGEDHFVPVNPLATSQVEVIRGPATLRYGSQAIGGVVASTNNRIPEALPCDPFSPLRPLPGITKAPPQALDDRGCATLELRGALASVDKGREGGALLDAGIGNFAFHADGFGRKSENYRVPNYPYLTPPDPVELPFATQPEGFNGRQPNSFNKSNEASVGGSYLFHGGFAGIAYVRNNNLYGIPGPDGEGHNTRIDAQQDKVLSKGEFRPSGTAIDAVRYWAGYTDYKHNELGLADPTDPSTDGIRQTFTNKDWEGRSEIQLMPFDLRFAALTTAVGVQGGHQKLTAPGDDPTNPLNGLFDPNKNTRVAGYIFNEFKFTSTTKAQLAGRIEEVRLSGVATTFDGAAPVFDVAVDPASVGPAVQRDLRFTPKSASAGLRADARRRRAGLCQREVLTSWSGQDRAPRFDKILKSFDG